MRTAILAFCLLTGCGFRAYRPDVRPFPGGQRTLGCLDVGVLPERRGDRLFLDVRVGNTCSRPQAFSIQALRVVDGEGHAVSLLDPRGELQLVHVDPETEGRAVVTLDRPTPTRLCVDLRDVAPDAPAAVVTPLCFEDRGLGFVVTP
ncbi:MAG: hypothetical protein JNL79_40280 [Myxococcales bacterium]|nr:hypothetical protein [Myxococcales bacterium]